MTASVTDYGSTIAKPSIAVIRPSATLPANIASASVSPRECVLRVSGLTKSTPTRTTPPITKSPIVGCQSPGTIAVGRTRIVTAKDYDRQVSMGNHPVTTELQWRCSQHEVHGIPPTSDDPTVSHTSGENEAPGDS